MKNNKNSFQKDFFLRLGKVENKKNKGKKKQLSREQRARIVYFDIRSKPTMHPSAWTQRGIKTGYDGYGCNQFTGCIPECPYYPDKVSDEYCVKLVEEYEEEV